jgi:hypothetical protein
MSIHAIERRIIRNIHQALTSALGAAAIAPRLENIIFSSEEEVCWGMYVNNGMLNQYSDEEIQTQFKYDRTSLVTGNLLNEFQIYDESDVYALDSLVGQYLGEDRHRIDAMDYLIYKICAHLEVNPSELQVDTAAEKLKLYPSADVNFAIRTLATKMVDAPYEDYFRRIRSWME